MAEEGEKFGGIAVAEPERDQFGGVAVEDEAPTTGRSELTPYQKAALAVGIGTTVRQTAEGLFNIGFAARREITPRRIQARKEKELLGLAEPVLTAPQQAEPPGAPIGT